MLRRNQRLFLMMVALLWLALIISLYYVSHKPFSTSLAVGLGSALWQTGVAIGIASVGGGLGLRLMPEMPLRPMAALALQAGLGLGLLSLGVLATGASFGIHPFLMWSGLLALGIFLRHEIRNWWRSWVDLAELWRASDGLGRAIAAGSVLILVFTWFMALAPPLKFDALVYHLALPRLYQMSGRIVYVPQIMFWGMPQTGEMLYTWAASLAGISSATALGWLAGVLALVGVLGFSAQSFGSRPAWVAVASLLSGHTFSASLAWGYVDWFTLLFGLGFLILLDEWRSSYSRQERGEGSGNRPLLLAGVFAGLALGSKYTAGVLLLAGLVAVLWTRRRDGVRACAASLFRFGLLPVLISLPWWIKNALATGNPFYPFFFPSGAMNPFRLDFYQIPVWGSWQEAVFLPWQATLQGLEGTYGFNASIGPLLLALGPLAWLGWSSQHPRVRTTLTTAGLVGLTGLLVWAAAGRLSGFLIQSRLYWAIFPALVLLAGAGFRGLDDLKLPQLRLGRVAGALLLVVFAFSVLQTGVAALEQRAPQALLSLVRTGDYLSDNLGWYAPAVQAVQDLPQEMQVVMLWEARSFHCAPKCQPDEVLDRWLNELNSRGSANSVLQGWRDAGYTHLLYNRFGADFVRREEPRYTAADWQALDDLLSRLPTPVDFGGAYQLYPLVP